MINLPKPHLSYSAASLWYSSKPSFRNKYYRNAPSISNIPMEFGKETADLLKDNPDHESLRNVIKYPIRDEGFTVDVDDVPVLMFPDTLSLDGIPSFREYKTSEWVEGDPTWTQKKVDDHMQLKLYSLGIKLQYGDVQNVCHLDWLITRMIKHVDQVKVGGKVYDVPIELPQLTGEVKTFATVVDDSERLRARMWIVQAAHEISADYKEFLKQ